MPRFSGLELWRERKHQVGVGQRSAKIPSVGGLEAATGYHHVVDLVSHHGQDVRFEVRSTKDLAAFGVDEIAMLADDIIELDQVFPNVEMETLHSDLGALHGPVDEPVLDRRVFVHSGHLHQAADAVAAEAFHDIVVEGNKEPGTARVALPAGAAAELIVNTPGFMPFGADNVKAPEPNDLVVFLLPVSGHTACGLRISAQYHVDAAACHVRGHGHGFQPAGLGHDRGFPLGVLGFRV